jgi:sarcosine oxidase
MVSPFLIIIIGVKMATEQFSETTTPSSVNKNVSAEEIHEMYENYVQPHFNNISNRCTKTVTCLYTTTPNFRFIIDRHPQFPNVIIASPCSGHGFKHSAAIGESLAQLIIDGKSKIDLSAFEFPNPK